MTVWPEILARLILSKQIFYILFQNDETVIAKGCLTTQNTRLFSVSIGWVMDFKSNYSSPESVLSSGKIGTLWDLYQTMLA